MSRTALFVSDAKDSTALCRLCMIYHEYSVNIFIPNDTFGMCAEMAIHDLLGLNVAEGDGLPNTICQQCVKKLMGFRDFKEMCLKSETELRKLDLGNLFRVSKVKDEDAADLDTFRESSSQKNTFLNDMQVTEVYITIPDELAMGNMCFMKEEWGSSENALVLKEEINDGENHIEGNVPMNTLTSVAIDPLAADTMVSKVKDEDAADLDTFREGSSQENTFLNDIQVTEVYISIPDELAMGNMCCMKEEWGSSENALVVKEEINDGENRIEGNVLMNTLTSVAIDPLAADKMCCVKEESVEAANVLVVKEEVDDGGNYTFCGISEQVLSSHSLDPLAVDTNMNAEVCDSSLIKNDSGSEGEAMDNDFFKETGESFEIKPLASEVQVDRCHETGGVLDCTDIKLSDLLSERQGITLGDEQCHSFFDQFGEGSLQGNNSMIPLVPQKRLPVKLVAGIQNNNIDGIALTKISRKFKGRMRSDKNYEHISQEGSKSRESTGFICDICGKKYLHLNLLAHHVKVHVAEKSAIHQSQRKGRTARYSLDSQVKGNKKLEQPLFVNHRKHFRHRLSTRRYTKLNDKTTFNCEEGGREFNDKETLLFHATSHSDKLPYKCDDCGKGFAFKNYLQRHVLVHSGLKPFKCGVCGKELKHKASLEKHSVVHNGLAAFKCEVCGKAFKFKSSLRKHSVNHNDVKAFKCVKCGKEFYGSGPLRSHILKMHTVLNTVLNIFKCDICAMEFSMKSHLTAHAATHTGSVPFKCDTCKKEFSQNVDLEKHRASHSYVGVFKCVVCGKMFVSKEDYRRHLSVHTRSKSFKCDICGASFSSKGNIIRHITVHTNLTLYKCEICSKDFPIRENWKRHLAIHTGLRPYKCHICGKKYSRSTYLKRHAVIHTGMKQFKCDACGKTFARKECLLRHIGIHTVFSHYSE